MDEVGGAEVVDKRRMKEISEILEQAANDARRQERTTFHQQIEHINNEM